MAAIQPFRFLPDKGDVSLEKNSPQELYAFLYRVLGKANEALKPEGYEVCYYYQENKIEGCIDPKQDVFLGVKTSSSQEPISTLCLRALDEETLKPFELLVEEVIAKVRQHIALKKTAGVYFTTTGSKFDLRNLKDYKISVSESGYLMIDKNYVFQYTHMGPWLLYADQFPTYTALKFFYDDEVKAIVIAEEYTLVSKDRPPMAIDPEATTYVSNKPCLEIKPMELTDEMREKYKGYFLKS